MSSLIEVHNRPSYILHILNSKIKNKIFSFIFIMIHYQWMVQKQLKKEKKLLKICYKIIFNSNWSKKRFLEGLENKFVNSNKLLIFYQSAKKKIFQF